MEKKGILAIILTFLIIIVWSFVQSRLFPPKPTKEVKKEQVVPLEQKKEAQEAGAQLVGGEELVEKIKSTGKIDADIAVATPEMMPRLATIAKILGPKGLMPNPKTKTVTPKVKDVIEALKKGNLH